MSFQESFCKRQFFVLVGLLPATPSLLSWPLLAPFVVVACGDWATSFLGEVPLVAETVSLEYWFRPSRPRAFWGGRPPLRGAGADLGSAAGGSGGVASVACGGIICSSAAGVGVGSESSSSIHLSANGSSRHGLRHTVALSSLGAPFAPICGFIALVFALLVALFLFPLALRCSSAWLLFWR